MYGDMFYPEFQICGGSKQKYTIYELFTNKINYKIFDSGYSGNSGACQVNLKKLGIIMTY